MAGRWIAGIGQLILALAGVALFIAWFVAVLIQFYGEINSDAPPRPVGGLGEAGALMFLASWLWALVTSLSLLREARQQEAAEFEQHGLRTDRFGRDAGDNVWHGLDMPKLNASEIQTALRSVPDWNQQGATITRTFQFKDFPRAIEFVNAVAKLAETAWHHPDIDVRWNKVTLTLTTHDAGGLTEKDFQLAQQFDLLA